jgi:hypothetical protein
MDLQTIILTLQRLEKLHRSLLEVALSKTEIIKTNDIEQLNLILKSEQSHIAAIEKLELQRQQQVTDYMSGKGLLIVEDPSVSTLIGFAKDEHEVEKLEEVRVSLVKVLAELKLQNDLNQKLVFQSLQFINVSLNMLRPQAPQEQINYSDKEILHQDRVSKKSYFDSQA